MLGVDPGMRGAIALVVADRCDDIFDMPLTKKHSGRNEVDVAAIICALSLWSSKYELTRCLIERTNAMPGQGVSGMFSMGDSFGVVRAIATVFCNYVDFVSPQKWKTAMLLTKDKDYSITVAKKKFPSAHPFLTLKKHEGRAEALLLADYARTHHIW